MIGAWVIGRSRHAARRFAGGGFGAQAQGRLSGKPIHSPRHSLDALMANDGPLAAGARAKDPILGTRARAHPDPLPRCSWERVDQDRGFGIARSDQAHRRGER
jgi:hypothetical protein